MALIYQRGGNEVSPWPRHRTADSTCWTAGPCHSLLRINFTKPAQQLQSYQRALLLKCEKLVEQFTDITMWGVTI